MHSKDSDERPIRKMVSEILRKDPFAPVDVVLANWCQQRRGGPIAIEADRIAEIYDETRRQLSNEAPPVKHRWWHPW